MWLALFGIVLFSLNLVPVIHSDQTEESSYTLILNFLAGASFPAKSWMKENQLSLSKKLTKLNVLFKACLA